MSIPNNTISNPSIHYQLTNAAKNQNAINNGIIPSSISSITTGATSAATGAYNWCNRALNGIPYPSFNSSHGSSDATEISGRSNKHRTDAISQGKYDSGQPTMALNGGKAKCKICGKVCKCKNNCTCKKTMRRRKSIYKRKSGSRRKSMRRRKSVSKKKSGRRRKSGNRR